MAVQQEEEIVYCTLLFIFCFPVTTGHNIRTAHTALVMAMHVDGFGFL